MTNEQSKQLMEILDPLFEEYDEIRISKEEGKVIIYGVNMQDLGEVEF